MNTILSKINCMIPGFCAGVVLFGALLPVRRRRLRARRLVSGVPREAALLFFCAYCGGMASITLVPYPSWLLDCLRGAPSPLVRPGQIGQHVILTLFSTLHDNLLTAGNVLLFVPFGFFAALLWRGGGFGRALGVALGVPLFIETWQLFVGRVSDINDLLLNAAGSLAGFALWLLVHRCAPALTARFTVRDAAP